MSGEKCYCYNDIYKGDELVHEDCYEVCPGNPAEKCGGIKVMSVFMVEKSE